MKIYTEVVWTWDEDKGELVEESSESFDYEGPVEMAKDYFKEIEHGWKMLFGLGDYQGKSTLKHNFDQLLDINTSGSLLGYLINPDEGLLWNFEGWRKKTFGSGDSNDDDPVSVTPAEIEEMVTPDPTPELDPGLDDAMNAPQFTDVSMASKRASTRKTLGSKGYDTRTSKGRITTETNKKRYGTALTRMS